MESVTIDPIVWPLVVHESAHCVVASRLGLVVQRVEICADGGASDVKEGTRLTNWSAPSVVLTDWLTCLLSGEVAEVEFFGKMMLPRVHAGSDRERLYRAVVHAGRLGEQCLFVARQRCPKLVHAHRGQILQLAHDLLARVHQAQGADVTVEADELVRLLGDDVAVLRLPVSG
jgi:hypothetical protein